MAEGRKEKIHREICTQGATAAGRGEAEHVCCASNEAYSPVALGLLWPGLAFSHHCDWVLSIPRHCGGRDALVGNSFGDFRRAHCHLGLASYRPQWTRARGSAVTAPLSFAVEKYSKNPGVRPSGDSSTVVAPAGNLSVLFDARHSTPRVHLSIAEWLPERCMLTRFTVKPLCIQPCFV